MTGAWGGSRAGTSGPAPSASSCRRPADTGWVSRKYYTEVGIISGVQVGWAGPGLGPGQQVPGPGEAGQGVGPQQVCPVYLGQAEVDTMYQHCRQVGTQCCMIKYIYTNYYVKRTWFMFI